MVNLFPFSRTFEAKVRLERADRILSQKKKHLAAYRSDRTYRIVRKMTFRSVVITLNIYKRDISCGKEISINVCRVGLEAGRGEKIRILFLQHARNTLCFTDVQVQTTNSPHRVQADRASANGRAAQSLINTPFTRDPNAPIRCPPTEEEPAGRDSTTAKSTYDDLRSSLNTRSAALSARSAPRTRSVSFPAKRNSYLRGNAATGRCDRLGGRPEFERPTNASNPDACAAAQGPSQCRKRAHRAPDARPSDERRRLNRARYRTQVNRINRIRPKSIRLKIRSVRVRNRASESSLPRGRGKYLSEGDGPLFFGGRRYTALSLSTPAVDRRLGSKLSSMILARNLPSFLYKFSTSYTSMIELQRYLCESYIPLWRI